jgi:ubiquinone/menaquinone biosynthesis C-methylase UbiE
MVKNDNKKIFISYPYKYFCKTNRDLMGSHKGLVEYIAKNYLNDSSINLLDVGCGDGDLEVILESKGFRNIYGLDVVAPALARVRKRCKYTKAITHDINTTLPFKNDEFEISTCIEVLEHTKNPIGVMQEMLRVSKKMIICVPNGFWQELSPINGRLLKTADWPNFYAPTYNWLKSAIKWSGGKVTHEDFWYVDTGIFRNLFPKYLSSSFLFTCEKAKEFKTENELFKTITKLEETASRK